MAKEIVAVPHNSLAAGTVIKGEIITDNDIRIDGRVEGNIDCKGKVVIGQSGNIEGNIVCANAEIIGALNGNLKAYEVLSVQSTGKIKGDIQTRTLVIEPNAVFNGSCAMNAD